MATINWKSSDELLSEAKTKKIDELKGKCMEVIQGGFKSSALGVEHTYFSDQNSMIYFNATYNRFANDPTFITVDWITADSGYLAHNKEQFIQVYHDGHDYGIQQEEHLKQLISDVSNAVDVSSVNVITW